MELFQLEQFRAIAKYGTISKAAGKLFLTQPTLSQNLKKLESELNCKLFIRTRNRLALTPCGEILLEYANNVEALTQKMQIELKETILIESKTIHMGIFSYSVASLLMPCIAEYNPEIKFDVTVCNTKDLIEGLENNRFDILIGTEKICSKHFDCIKLYDEQAYISMPLEDRLSKSKKLTGSNLSGHRYLIETNVLGYSDWYSSIMNDAKITNAPIKSVEFQDYLKMKDSINLWSFTSDFFPRFIKRSDMRSVIPIDEDYAWRSIWMMLKPDATPLVTSFIENLNSNLRKFLSGGSFVSYYLFPENIQNLNIHIE